MIVQRQQRHGPRLARRTQDDPRLGSSPRDLGETRRSETLLGLFFTQGVYVHEHLHDKKDARLCETCQVMKEASGGEIMQKDSEGTVNKVTMRIIM